MSIDYTDETCPADFNALSSKEIADRRAEYDTYVETWKLENPRLAASLSSDTVEAYWEQLLSHVSPIYSRTSGQPVASKLDYVQKRRSTSESEISNARQLVQIAMEETRQKSLEISKNPRRNHYSLKGSNGGKKGSKRDLVRPIITEEVRKAAALIAELEAQDLDREGRLYKEYNITIKDQATGRKEQKIQSYRSRSRRAGEYWLAQLGSQHPGRSPFQDDPGYKVFRNVRDYGARGDGKTDDTEAINRAISDGNRCGDNCGSSTVKPATVYFPPGTYLVSTSIIAMYYTQLVGDISSATSITVFLQFYLPDACAAAQSTSSSGRSILRGPWQVPISDV